jgi:hypothetical protein
MYGVDEFPPGGTQWEMLHEKMTMEVLGFLPSFLHESDPRPAREQINERYRSSWFPITTPGIKLRDDNVILYPRDPPYVPLAQTRLRDELIVYYPHAFVAIIQPDRSFEVARID